MELHEILDIINAQEGSVGDLTGTVTVNLKIRSANATATQTCRLVNLTINKVSPVSV